MSKRLLSMACLLCLQPLVLAQLSLEPIATNLLNPRGVVVLSETDLLVVEAGSGKVANPDGRISHFRDLNVDGDFDDEAERIVLLERLASYNTLKVYGSGHDEIGGAGDIIKIGERFYFTLDNPVSANLADGAEIDIRIQEVDLQGNLGEVLIRRNATLNSLVYDSDKQVFYVLESGNNSLGRVNDGRFEYLSIFPHLTHGQQAVPAGLALEPAGTLLVAIFSGQVFNGATFDSYVQGDSKVVRVNPETGETKNVITGLTTAVDVAVDEAGNIFVLELTSGEALEKLPPNFSLADPKSLPMAGGYPRQQGRLIRFRADGSGKTILLERY